MAEAPGDGGPAQQRARKCRLVWPSVRVTGDCRAIPGGLDAPNRICWERVELVDYGSSGDGPAHDARCEDSAEVDRQGTAQGTRSPRTRQGADTLRAQAHR
jgi:hypothetical protein